MNISAAIHKVYCLWDVERSRSAPVGQERVSIWGNSFIFIIAQLVGNETIID